MNRRTRAATERLICVFLLLTSFLGLTVTSQAQCNKDCRERLAFLYPNAPDCWIYFVKDCYYCNKFANGGGCTTDTPVAGDICILEPVEQFFKEGLGVALCPGNPPPYSQSSCQSNDDWFSDELVYVCGKFIS
jgi:hypothetical protein